jgi:hypothetical protein
MSTALSAESANPGTAIVGGGISGLYSALLALDSGQRDIHVYEATDRVGGKIKSTTVNGQVLNMGAEFIDDEHSHIVDLVNRLQHDPEFRAKYPGFVDALELQPCIDQKTALFQGPDGKVDRNFITQYAPVAEQVIHDREIMESNLAYAAQLKSMPLPAYLNHLHETVTTDAQQGLLTRLWHKLTLQSNRVPMSVIAMAADSFSGEGGQPVANITAAQFIAETSPTVTQFLGCGASSRVKGGTHAMIEALHHYLEDKGVHFHFGEKLESATKGAQGGVDLTFASANGTHSLHTPNAMIGLPSYALAGVKGLETFGLPPQATQMLADVQYTNNVKFTIPLKPGVQVPQLNLFSPGGVESWTPAPGFLTFLCNNHDGLKPAQLVKQCVDSYVAAYGQGKTADDLFDMGPGKIAMANPGKAGCWSTPSHKNAVANEQLFKKMESLADQGLGLVGTYMPLDDGGVGFMECGAASAERVHARMMAAAQERSQEAAMPRTHFQDMVRSAAPAAGVPAMAM